MGCSTNHRSGNVTQYVQLQDDGNYTLEVVIAVASMITCLLQFYFGRLIGKKFGRVVAGGQGLGQKYCSCYMAYSNLS